jgi:hypothetical protein
MKIEIENHRDHADALRVIEWVTMLEARSVLIPSTVCDFIHELAAVVEDYEQTHWPLGKPNPDDPCFDCDHVHRGPVKEAVIAGYPAGRTCVESVDGHPCPCTFRCAWPGPDTTQETPHE